MNIYCGNLSYDVTDSMLKRLVHSAKCRKQT